VIARQASCHRLTIKAVTGRPYAGSDKNWTFAGSSIIKFICGLGRPDLTDHCRNCRLHTERALSTALRVVSDRFGACGRVCRYRYNTTNGHREPVSHRRCMSSTYTMAYYNVSNQKPER
jgi:hypothetical protein